MKFFEAQSVHRKFAHLEGAEIIRNGAKFKHKMFIFAPTVFTYAGVLYRCRELLWGRRDRNVVIIAAEEVRHRGRSEEK